MCSLYAPEADETFEMYINGVPSSQISPEDPWHKADFFKKNWTYDNGTVETYVHGWVRELSSAHNETHIDCVSSKYQVDNFSTEIILHSTDSNTGTSEDHLF